jgi:hypothetical protein
MLKHNKENPLSFLVEEDAYEGVKRLVAKVRNDFFKVSGATPTAITKISDTDSSTVLFATLGYSPIVDKLVSAGMVDVSGIQDKREVYQRILIENPWGSAGIDKSHEVLLIIGSDKRGTIYGLFSLSEYIGVSPLHFWGDVEPLKRESIVIEEDIVTVSKEPSIKYRGFFINDEWPCFGNWTFNHYGGFTAEMYDHVFELLLRLKGNYMWPAMWTSSFPIDGPGNLSEELADIYGVAIGYSHHEPCLRASEEWDVVRGPHSEYGNEWNYYTNKEGLLKYWEDGLKRSGHLEKIITIGIRGERDSSMLGADATLQDNIDLLKDVIINQRRLIKEYVSSDSPELIALYKEVEEYFYGNDEVAGLKDWDGLEDVICMFCEDNFGFVRSLPTEELGNRKYGMYYHFDYHGSPISYEWMPSTTFERTKDQMSMAYEHGIRDVWIVNVGDLKFNEVPLSFFMALAYDFDKYGTSAPLAVETVTDHWLKATFPQVEATCQEKIGQVLHGYIRMNSLRRPEALNAGIYHPCHYLEADRMLGLAMEIDEINDNIYRTLEGNARDAYYSMIYIPAKASVNLLRMHLYSGKNIHYAKQGKKIANHYAKLVTMSLARDKSILADFAKFKSGKWKGMELEEHIGFTQWNEDNCRYPLRVQVEPFHKPRLVVNRKDQEEVYHKAYFEPLVIEVDDFLYEGNSYVIIEVANDGTGDIGCYLEWEGDTDWLTVNISPEISEEIDSFQIMGRLTDGDEFSVEDQKELILYCDRSKLTREVSSLRLMIKGNDGTAIAIDIKAKATDIEGLPPRTFLNNRGVVVIDANHYSYREATKLGGFEELFDYGRTGSGMKVFPLTSCFVKEQKRPSLTYNFLVEEPGEYVVEVWTTPTNPVKRQKPLRFMVNERILTAVTDTFDAGNPKDLKWCAGVLDNIRRTDCVIRFQEGVQQIVIKPLEPGLIVERIIIYKTDYQLRESYLGPKESYYTR